MAPGNDAKKKKPPNRRNLDARREQNRIAARNYREKRKQKLDLLTQLLDEGDDGLAPEPTSTYASTSDPQSFESSPSSLVNPSLLSHASTSPSNEPQFTDQHLSLARSQPTPSAAPDSSVLAILNSIRHLSPSQKVELLQHLQSQVFEPAGATNLSSRRSPSYDHGNWVSARPRQGPTHTRLQLEARRFALFINQHASGPMSPAQLSRIYAAESGLFGAIFANCYALGMTDVEAVMIDDGASIFCPGLDVGHEPSQLDVVRPRFSDLTPDLQPCDIQLTFGHHPYLDVLPWRTFRKKALEALRHDPPLLDEEELCHDICIGGLICWGGQQNSMGMEAGVPWDMRSWEPAIWFMKKYRSLVGDWNDDMWKSVRWWHNARGERLAV